MRTLDDPLQGDRPDIDTRRRGGTCDLPLTSGVIPMPQAAHIIGCPAQQQTGFRQREGSGRHTGVV
jgi:hypothetical protein